MRALRVDFGQRQIHAPLGWMVLTLGIACAAFGTRAYLSAKTQRDIAVTERAQAAESLRQRQAAMQRRAEVDQSPGYLRDKRWQRAALELRAPWLLTLSALEHATKPPVFLTGVRSEQTSGRLHIDAEAPSLEAALGYVQTLNKAAPLRDTWLLRHEEIVDPASGRQIVRFSVQAAWLEPAK